MACTCAHIPLQAPTRRQVLLVGAAALAWQPGSAQLSGNPAAMQAAIAAFTGGQQLATGRVHLDIAPLVENGNTVPISVRVDSAMTSADHVRRIALFTERNPQPEVAVFELSLLSGRAEVATRMRLATSQRVVALAQMNDGRWHQQQVDVVVTLAACVEGG
jgi:sulfur-oxidizing protein SoxY